MELHASKLDSQLCPLIILTGLLMHIRCSKLTNFFYLKKIFSRNFKGNTNVEFETDLN